MVVMTIVTIIVIVAVVVLAKWGSAIGGKLFVIWNKLLKINNMYFLLLII